MASKSTLRVETFKALGIELEHEGNQQVGYCPKCGKRKLYVDPETTQFNCKVCQYSGNATTAVRDCVEEWKKNKHKKATLDRLVKMRGLPREAFKFKDFVRDNNNNLHWIVYDLDNKICGTRRAVPMNRGTKYQIRQMKGRQLSLVNLPDARKCSKIYITEGDWDFLAARLMIKNQEPTAGVMGLPGAGVFKKEWYNVFRAKDVVFINDHDEPGYKGALKIGKSLKGIANSVHHIQWPDQTKDGYDLNDLYRDLGEKECYDFIRNHLVIPKDDDGNETHPESEEVKHYEPISVSELHRIFHKWLLLDNCDLLDVCIAVMLSNHLPDDPLWLMVVAPPSSSKSETMVPLSHHPEAKSISKLTPQALISGMLKDGGNDPSLFAELEGKEATLIIKDLTPILEGPEMVRDEVFGLLRDAYDGSCVKQFGNGAKREYNDLKFSMLAGVTPMIDAYGNAGMGERFLRFRADHELNRENDVERAIRAITNSANKADMKQELTDAVLGSLARGIEWDNVPKPDMQFAVAIAKISNLTASMRAVSPSDVYSGSQDVAPNKEAPMRLACQLTKLARGLTAHYEVDSLNDKKVMNIIRRVALHTPDIITVRIIRALYDEQGKFGITNKELASCVKGLTSETVRVILQKLCRTEVVEQQRPETGGMSGITYTLSESVRDVIDEYKLFKGLPKNDPFWRKPGLKLKRKSK